MEFALGATSAVEETFGSWLNTATFAPAPKHSKPTTIVSRVGVQLTPPIAEKAKSVDSKVS